MASREEMALFRAARSGQAHAQIALARRYFTGSAGLPRSVETGFHWLARAARQGSADACSLIGIHVPLEVAQREHTHDELAAWYERACDEGIVQAGLALAKLVLVSGTGASDAQLRDKAIKSLESAAQSGIPEAQWLFAQQLENQFSTHGSECIPDRPTELRLRTEQRFLHWIKCAAQNGVLPAQRRLADHAWSVGDDATFLEWSLPIARAITGELPSLRIQDRRLYDEDLLLLSRCAQALIRRGDLATDMVKDIAERAAQTGDRYACLFLGLWHAKMDRTGKRIAGIARLINYRMAIQWLTLAGKQGMAEAWYVASRIYLRPEFTHRSIAEAERLLSYAAHAGDRAAQLELGQRLWRKRRHCESNDVKATYWLQRASAQGCGEAAALLRRIAPPLRPASWAHSLERDARLKGNALLAARVMLAASFGLSKHEALLLDMCAADHGHCIVVDLRDQRIRTRRRLILVETGEQRRVLDDIKRVFERAAHASAEVEGNYRQRMYRLENALPTRITQLQSSRHAADRSALLP